MSLILQESMVRGTLVQEASCKATGLQVLRPKVKASGWIMVEKDYPLQWSPMPHPLLSLKRSPTTFPYGACMPT